MAKPATRTPSRSRTSNLSTRPQGRWPWLLLLLAVIIGGLLYAFRVPITGYGDAGAAYSARVACSCRFVAGRDLGDCEKDQLNGMQLVVLSEDEEERSVTATFPLVASETARLRDGYGCVLDRWEG